MRVADARWQNARAERRGVQFKLDKIDIEESIESYGQMASALMHATMTKNQWSRRRGYPPELLVFGKCARVPGSNVSDNQVGSHLLAFNPASEGAQFDKTWPCANERAKLLPRPTMIRAGVVPW